MASRSAKKAKKVAGVVASGRTWRCWKGGRRHWTQTSCAASARGPSAAPQASQTVLAMAWKSPPSTCSQRATRSTEPVCWRWCGKGLLLRRRLASTASCYVLSRCNFSCTPCSTPTRPFALPRLSIALLYCPPRPRHARPYQARPAVPFRAALSLSTGLPSLCGFFFAVCSCNRPTWSSGVEGSSKSLC